MSDREDVSVLIVGGGPAGLSAATALARGGVTDVVVVEREAEAGGVPRHTNHLGFGMHDLHRLTTGPRYASELVARARDSGARIRTCTQVTDWTRDGAALVTSPSGCSAIHAEVTILATGCRERPRSARMVAGDRAAGVHTTSSLQRSTFLFDRTIGSRAVVCGAEHVSFSAVMTLKEAGCSTVALVTPHARHQTFGLLRWYVGLRQGPGVLTDSTVTGIRGRGRVEAVDVMASDGTTRTLLCDTVVFTGDWIPENELVWRRGLELEPGTRGPVVDAQLRTTIPNVLAAGNLLRGAEGAGVAALEGRAAARTAMSILDGMASPSMLWSSAAPILRGPIAWVHPSRLSTMPTPGRLTLWPSQSLPAATMRVRAGGHLLGTRRVRRAVPNRPLRVRVDTTGVPRHVLDQVEVELSAD